MRWNKNIEYIKKLIEKDRDATQHLLSDLQKCDHDFAVRGVITSKDGSIISAVKCQKCGFIDVVKIKY